jgi:polysaccharide export outer membrane protein
MIIKRMCLWCCLCISLVVGLMSCSVKKSNLLAPYLDSTRTVTIDKYPFPYQEPTIQANEFVEVRFAGLNPNVSSTLNNYGGANLQTSFNDGSTSFSGQQVDIDGYLNFPLIGKVKAVGLTLNQLRTELLARVDTLLRDPYIYVGLPKRGVTLLGEVKSSGTIVFPKERANIMEFIAKSGAFTDFADIRKVKIYREEPSGKRIIGNLNLNDTSLFQSPFFYPQPNDVVYVPASGRKRAQDFRTLILPYISTAVSVVSILLVILRN